MDKAAFRFRNGARARKSLRQSPNTALLEHTDVVLIGKRLHTPDQCKGEICCLHNRSNHNMRDFPQLWRFDRYLMERVCPHGVGHPDPDHLDWVRRTKGDQAASGESIHGCDGCCRKPATPAPTVPAVKRRIFDWDL